MIATPRASSGLPRTRRSTLFRKSLAAVDLPAWPALLGLLLIFSISVILTATVIHHDGMYSPLNRSPRRQYQALHDQYLHSAVSFFTGVRDRTHLGLNSSNASNQSRSISFDIGGDVSGVSTAVVVMASKRRVPYIQVWAWSLLTGSSARDLNRTSVTIVNTQRPSSAISEDLQPLRDAGIAVVDMYESDTSEVGGGKTLREWIVDEYLCHIQALRACDRGVSWCIVFEEDSLMTRNLLGKFHTHVVEGLASRGDVCMVKLFTTDAWSGYQWPSWLLELLLIPGCLAAVLTAPLCYFVGWINSMVCEKRRQNVTQLPSSISPPKKRGLLFKLAVVFATLFFNIVIVAEVMSRQSVISMLDFPGIHIDPCTSAASAVAVAFPIEISQQLRKHLEEIIVRSGRTPRLLPIDLEVYAWAGRVGLSVVQTSPSLAQHIGLFSSNPLKENAQYLNQDSRFRFLAQDHSLPRALSRLVPTW